MAKEPEVATATTGTTRPGFNAPVTTDNVDDLPVKPSQKTLDEMAAGRQAVQEGAQPIDDRLRPINPVNADPARAAEIADAMNMLNEARDLETPEDLVPAGEAHPGEVMSRGLPAGGPLDGVPPEGTPDRVNPDPTMQDAPPFTSPVGAKAKYYREHDAQAEAREVLKSRADNRDKTQDNRDKNAPKHKDKERIT